MHDVSQLKSFDNKGLGGEKKTTGRLTIHLKNEYTKKKEKRKKNENEWMFMIYYGEKCVFLLACIIFANS